MTAFKDFNFSYWEVKAYFNRFDLIVIGSGIVGLSTAISFKLRNKKAKILILERGLFADGASSKNAGFACFGSAGELLDDLSKMPENEVWDTVKMRWEGLQILRSRLKDRNLDFRPYGGYELFKKNGDFEECSDKLPYLNRQIKNLLNLKECYVKKTPETHRFRSIKGLIFNAYEGQIDTSLMMKNLITLAHKNNIQLLNNVTAKNIRDNSDLVEIECDCGIFKASKVVIATNGFAASLLNIKNVKPARAQVLITKPIKNLKLKGTFHYQQGYYYFRNIDNRILLGGGRNLDFKTETTMIQGLNTTIQEKLDIMLKEIILPETPFEIEQRWSGIMGVGSEKKPIIKKVSKNVLAAVRMGGMGVAIGSLVGEKAANTI